MSAQNKKSMKRQKVTHQQSIAIQKKDKNKKFVDQDILLILVYQCNLSQIHSLRSKRKMLPL